MRFLLAILLLLIAAPAYAQQGQGMSKAMVVSSCGGGALPSGPVTNLTMDTTGRLCQSGIGSNVCSQATAYLARTTGGNEGGHAANITALICGLVSDGVIDGDLTGATGCGSHLDLLYVLAQQNAADAKLNLCGTSYSLTAVNAITFTSYVGFGGFAAVSGYLDTGFIPGINTSTPTGNYTQNSASFGVWSNGVVNENFQMGTGVINAMDNNDIGDGNFYVWINHSAAAAGPAPSAAHGSFIGDRTDASNIHLYTNGVSTGPLANPALDGLDSNSFWIGGISSYGGVFSAQTLCEAHVGASLGATLDVALYNRLRTYMTAVGVP